jgi:HK97 family phage prohead protease
VEREYRSTTFTDAELDGMNFRGYAAVFDAPWNDALVEAMGYVEQVARGAFRKALAKGHDVPLLWQHERRDMLATTKSGTLRLKEDGKGLLVEAQLPENGLGAYVREMIDRGDVQGMSYGIESLPSDSILVRKDGVMHRTIANVRRLLDTSLTYEPSYEATEVELRSAIFAARPLQELLDGEGSQIEDTATVTPPRQISVLRGQMADVLISELDLGGWPS